VSLLTTIVNSQNNFAEKFEDLRIWQESRVQAVAMYRSFGAGTPAERDRGFRDQIQRASLSVMNNIAEGFERRTPADFARFLDNAKGSCGEVRSMLYLAEDLSYVPSPAALEFRAAAIGLAKGIEALAKSLRSRVA
jgi:four helix bundle protein